VYAKRSLHEFARCFAAVVPALLMATWWFPRLTASRSEAGFDISPHWFTYPWERVSPELLVKTTFGMLRGPVEPILAALLLIWVLGGVLAARSGARPDMRLVLAAMPFALIALLGPDKYVHTVSFASRWFPVAVILIIVSLPRPKLPHSLLLAAPLLAMAVASAAHARAWTLFEQEELDGLTEALAALPERPAVVGLDWVKESRYMEGRPFIQTFAYAQVLHGGTLSFSFADHQSEIVVYQPPRQPTWTVALEWAPENIQMEDFRVFPYVIVNGTTERHRSLEATGMIEPVTNRGRWRCYVRPGTR
jgi:hypothetical protein